MAATKQATRNKSGAGAKKKTSRCWPGYEPTPGKKPGAEGSCKKKGS